MEDKAAHIINITWACEGTDLTQRGTVFLGSCVGCVVLNARVPTSSPGCYKLRFFMDSLGINALD
jgi:hypothetical protein